MSMMNISKFKHAAVLCMALIGASLSLPVLAQSHNQGSVAHGNFGSHGRGGGGWHGAGDRHGDGGWHRGGPGWWGFGLGLGLGWESAWPEPYPYPDYPYVPPPVIVEPSAPPVQEVPATPPASTWYYCDSARGYYPYVKECPEGWRSVPAAPPGMER